MTLHVEVLLPDRSLWSGEAGLVIAKTIDGDIGVMTGHAPVFGILSPGSVVRVREVPGDENNGDVVRAAVRDGFLSVTNDRVSILASSGELSGEVDAGAAQAVRIVTDAAFHLNAGFRENTTPMYFDLLGYRSEYSSLTQTGWLNPPDNRRFIRNLIAQFFDAAIGSSAASAETLRR